MAPAPTQPNAAAPKRGRPPSKALKGYNAWLKGRHKDHDKSIEAYREYKRHHQAYWAQQSRARAPVIEIQDDSDEESTDVITMDEEEGEEGSASEDMASSGTAEEEEEEEEEEGASGEHEANSAKSNRASRAKEWMALFNYGQSKQQAGITLSNASATPSTSASSSSLATSIVLAPSATVATAASKSRKGVVLKQWTATPEGREALIAAVEEVRKRLCMGLSAGYKIISDDTGIPESTIRHHHKEGLATCK
jgi:hypothetical protein